MLSSGKAEASPDQSPVIPKLLENFSNNTLDEAAFRSFLTNIVPLKADVKPPKAHGTCAVFKGGGVKVTAYLGVLQALQEKGLLDDLKFVAGSSGAAIIALLLALGFDGHQIVRLFNQLDLTDFTDYRSNLWGSSMASHMFSVLTQGKIYSGKNMRDWAGGLIEHVLDDEHASFADLKEAQKDNPCLKSPYFVATRLQPDERQSQEVVFGFDKYPNVRILDAFCASTALPPIYEPVLVHEKNGRAIGYCNDGGLLNNFPVGIFDSRQYLEPHYRLESTNYQDDASSFAINPGTMGFSLVTHLSQLDPNITPFTDRLRSLATKLQPAGGTQTSVQEHRWTHWDLLKGIFKYYFGKLEAENSERKYQTHPENTIQIFAEFVETTEFDLSTEKATLIIQSGYHAFLAWQSRFRNPSAPHPHDNYIDKIPLTPEEAILKREDKGAFYMTMAAGFMRKMMVELERCQKSPEYDWKDNVRLQFLSFQLNQIITKKFSKLDDPSLALSKAHTLASEQYHERINQMRQNRRFLEHLVDLDGTLRHLSHLLRHTDQPDYKQKFDRLFSSQLSKIFVLCLNKDNNLLNVAASSNPSYIDYMIRALVEKYAHLIQINRGFAQPLVVMLNTIPPTPILYSANTYKTTQSVNLCLERGLDPTIKNKDGKTAIHHAIDIDNAESLVIYCQWMSKNRVKPAILHHGLYQQPLLHYIIDSGNIHLLEALMAASIVPKGESCLSWLLKAIPMDCAQVTFLERQSLTGDVSLWANLKSRFYSDLKLTSAQCRESAHTKRQAYMGKLSVAKETLWSEAFYNPEKLSLVANRDLLALLGEQTETNIVLLSIAKHWNGFVKAALSKLMSAGFKREIDVFIRAPILGKSLLEHAIVANNEVMKRQLNTWLDADEDRACALHHMGEGVELTYQFSQQEVDYRLHAFAQRGKAQEFMRCFTQLFDGADTAKQFRESTSRLNEANMTPLHLIVKHGRNDIIKLLKSFLLEKDLGLEHVFDLESELVALDVIKDLRQLDRGLSEDLIEMIKSPALQARYSSASTLEQATAKFERLAI